MGWVKHHYHDQICAAEGQPSMSMRRNDALESRLINLVSFADSLRMTANRSADGTVLSYVAAKDLIFAIDDLQTIVERFADRAHVRELRAAIERAANPVREAAE